MNVFDSSALLAVLQEEPGADSAAAALEAGGRCGAANWSEVAQKVLAHGRSWDLSRAFLLSHPLSIDPVTAQDAERAAGLWVRGSGLSLADRLCLALAERVDASAVWTADAAWGRGGRIRQIR